MIRTVLVGPPESLAERGTARRFSLEALLKSAGCTVDFHPAGKKDSTAAGPYDAIVCLGHTGFDQARKRYGDLPLVWIAEKDPEEKWLSAFRTPGGFDRAFHIVDGTDHPALGLLTPEVIAPLLPLPQPQAVRRRKSRPHTPVRVLVDIRSAHPSVSPLWDVLRLLNRTSGIETVLKGAAPAAPFLGPFVTEAGPGLAWDAGDFDLVIANRDTALEALLKKVPCLVAGDKGYGGWVHPFNVESLCREWFNGRDGGYPGERIPISLMRDELTDLLSRPVPAPVLGRIRKKLTAVRNRQVRLLGKTLASLTGKPPLKKEAPETEALRLNGYFRLVKTGREEWHILDPLAKFHFNIGQAEYRLLHAFAKPTEAGAAIRRAGLEDDPETAREFIEELLQQKILVRHAPQHF